MSDEQLKERIAQLEQDIEQARAHEKTLGDLLEKKLNEIYTHYHISRTIGSLLDLEEMLRQVMGTVKKSLPVERVSIYLLDENREKLELVFFSGLNIQHKLTLDIGDKARPGGSSKTANTSTFTISRSSMKHSVILSILPTKKSAKGPISVSLSKYIMPRSA